MNVKATGEDTPFQAPLPNCLFAQLVTCADRPPQGVAQARAHRHRHTKTETQRHRDTHTQTHTDTHTDTERGYTYIYKHTCI